VWWATLARRPVGLVCEEDEGDDWCEDECEKDCCSDFHLRVLPFAYDQNLARRCAVVKQCFADGSKRIFLPVLGALKRLGHGLAAIGGLKIGDCP
jgi:hypothetical protein